MTQYQPSTVLMIWALATVPAGMLSWVVASAAGGGLVEA
jgi:hypothetical protein